MVGVLTVPFSGQDIRALEISKGHGKSLNVKRVADVNLPGDGDISTKDREKVSGTDDGVNVHNRHDPILVAVEIWLNNPHDSAARSCKEIGVQT